MVNPCELLSVRVAFEKVPAGYFRGLGSPIVFHTSSVAPDFTRRNSHGDDHPLLLGVTTREKSPTNDFLGGRKKMDATLFVVCRERQDSNLFTSKSRRLPLNAPSCVHSKIHASRIARASQ